MSETDIVNALAAEVHTVVFHNPENGYVVARVRVKDEPGLVTIVGNVGTLVPGESVVMKGKWKNHPKFGRQLEVHQLEQSYPASESGVIKFLQSSLRGVGEKTAQDMVDSFGVKVLDILDDDPERLLKIRGISPAKLNGIVESWGKQREIKNLIVFLHTNEVPATYAARIFQLYGAESIAKLTENPYELAYEIRGVGFKTADNMALKLGFAPDSPERIEAAIVYVLFTLSERGGHMYGLKDKLLAEVSKMLDYHDYEGLEQALYSLKDSGRIHMERLPGEEESIAVFLMHFYRYENEISQRLYGLVSHPKPVSRSKVEKVLPKVESELGFELSEQQRDAVFQSCINQVFIVTGGPGTGKTTITKAIVRTLAELGLKIKLAAPTGRAAKRLSEATGYSASTLHRLLQYAPESGFHYNQDQKLKTEVLVVDESSMLDAQLCLAVLRALPLTSRLILVGDVNQLPSVGPGNVLADILNSGVAPSAVLSHIYRQAQESGIVVNAHRINEGKFPLPSEKQAPEADFFWVEQEDPAKVQSIIVDTVCERIPERYGLDPMRDIQVLTPMHKGDVGTVRLNSLLQDRLNPLPVLSRGLEIRRGMNRFRLGDRVLQLRNNYEKEVFNGDLGWIVELDSEDGELAVEFDGDIVHYEASDLDDLTLAYAVSVHKSQGSEYPAIVVPVVTQHYMLLQRNLLYTALTRAMNLAVLAGSKRAFTIGLKNVTAGSRQTLLKHRLTEMFGNSLPFS